MKTKEQIELLGRIEKDLSKLVNETEVKSFLYPILMDMLIKVRGILYLHRIESEVKGKTKNENEQA